jgi:hypothetical protein
VREGAALQGTDCATTVTQELYESRQCLRFVAQTTVVQAAQNNTAYARKPDRCLER